MINVTYCGIKDPPPAGMKRGTEQQCYKLKQVRYYGIKKIDPKLFESVKEKKEKLKELRKDYLKVCKPVYEMAGDLSRLRFELKRFVDPEKIKKIEKQIKKIEKEQKKLYPACEKAKEVYRKYKKDNNL